MNVLGKVALYLISIGALPILRSALVWAGYLQYLQITIWTYGTAAAAATVPSSHSLLAATTTTRLTICTAVQ